MKRNLFLLSSFLNFIFLNAQMALDQTVTDANGQTYKTIAFANGNINYTPHPSYNISGTKNIDTGTSDTWGGQPTVCRIINGVNNFVNTSAVGGLSVPTIPNEIVGNTTITWTASSLLQKTVVSNSNSLGINFSLTMKRGRADTNNDGIVDAQISIYSLLPTGTTAQNAGFLPGDIMIFSTPIIVNNNGGATLLDKKFSYKLLNSNYIWEETLNGPIGWSQRNIIDWVAGNLSTTETQKSTTQIYPNPAKDFINIKNEKTENLSYQIFDISGKLILSGKSKSNEKIDIQTLEKGNYFLQIQNGNGQKENLKLIKN
jgi:hypothetical protein